MDKIVEILKNVRDDVDFEKETALVDDGIFDSFDVVGIVSDLQAEYDIEFSINDIVPENFNSVAGIKALVERLLDED